MPRRTKSKKLKQLEEKLKIIKKEIARKKKFSASCNNTPSKSKRSRKPLKSPFEECLHLLEKIKKIQYSKAFLEPVDWKGLNIPTYPQIIKHPMDINTIQRKLKSNEYQNPYEFATDMRLIYQNATTFNKATTPYYQNAIKFAKKFEEEFERKVVDQHENNDFTRKIHKVISTLIKREDSIPFRAPVNPQVLEIPDYLDVIETPMDLGTILNKINYYTHFKHFVHDLFLVWDNCCRYNPKQNQIHQTALKLREYTEKQLNRLCPHDFELWREDDTASPNHYNESTLTMNHTALIQTTLAPGPTPLTHSFDNDIEMQTANDDIFKICDEMDDEEEANKMMISYLVKKEELDPDGVGSLDFHQKEELQRGIQCLDSDHFDPLINMLQSFIPEGEGEDDEVELDVDSIDDSLQVKMYNYMLQAIHQQEAERIKREGGNNNIININNNNNNNNNKIEIIHANGKGGIHDIHVEVETEIPNVVTSFPTNNDDEYTFKEEEEVDIDIDMQQNDNDIIADITNVVETNASDGIITVIQSNEDENKVNVNDNDNNEIAQVIPTMPALSVDDDDNKMEKDDDDGVKSNDNQVKNEDVKLRNETEAIQQTENVNEEINDPSNNVVNEEENDEDVDTPLADDIDF